jgi:glutathione S-transferase
MILHHYDFSNFSEKVRLVLGHKQLAWQSVTIPAYAPKPDYTPLTAGYRRTPALQIGADVYCDTRLIVDVIDLLKPEPTLYPGPDPLATRALCEVLTSWAETSLMRPLALYITGLHAERFEPEFHADRARLHGKAQPNLEQVQASAAKYQAQVAAQLRWLEDLLKPGQDFVLAEGLSVADFALYEAPWFLRIMGGDEALPATLTRVRAWAERISAIGHGQYTTVTAASALQQAHASTPRPLAASDYVAAEGIQPGDKVTVSPFDQFSPATGTLVRVDEQRITLASEHAVTGPIHVHFPRLGYRLGRLRHST